MEVGSRFPLSSINSDKRLPILLPCTYFQKPAILLNDVLNWVVLSQVISSRCGRATSLEVDQKLSTSPGPSAMR